MFYQTKPIWIKNKSTELNIFAVFRLKSKIPQDTTLHITGATFYRIFVDGKFLGFGPARAGLGYAREDILPLQQSEQEIEILIEVCGYYCRSLSTVLQPSFLLAELQCNGQVLAYTGRDFEAFLPSCKVQKTERYSRQRHFTEVWDYRNFSSMTDEQYCADIEELDLDLQILDRRVPNPLYQDIDIYKAVIKGNLVFDENLKFRKEKYSRTYLPDDWGFWKYDEIEHHAHTWIQRQRQTITKRQLDLPLVLQKGEYAIVDFGVLEAGFFKIQWEDMAESNIVIAFAEYYQGEQFELPNMNAHNVLEYFLPNGVTRSELSFEPYTCRFAMIAVKEGCIKLHSFGIKTFMFDITGIEYPDYQNDSLNMIYRAAVKTFAHNAVDLYMDCPSRERAGWLCDSYFTAKTEYALTGKTKVEDAFLENFRLYKNRGEIHKGAIPMCYPADIETDDPEGRFIPQWTMWYILEVAEYVLKRGHAHMAEDFKESIYQLLQFYRQYENSDGLLEHLPSWNFVEWSKANDWVYDVNYPTNFLYAQVLQSIADLYSDEECRVRSSQVRKKTIEQSFNGTYFLDHAVRKEDGTLCLMEDSSEACQYYAVLFGQIDLNASKFQGLKHLILHVFSPERNGVMPEIMEVNAFIGAYLRLEVLLQIKEYELLLHDVIGFFGNMGEYTGTLWENRQFSGSYDHGFSSYALAAIKEAMEGLGKSV